MGLILDFIVLKCTLSLFFHRCLVFCLWLILPRRVHKAVRLVQRMAVAIVFNVSYGWRADVFLLPRGFEMWDLGYFAWLGLLQADRLYSNPHVLCFVELLVDKEDDGAFSTSGV